MDVAEKMDNECVTRRLYSPILKKLEKKKIVTIHMANGRPKNFEEYQRLVGRIEGFAVY